MIPWPFEYFSKNGCPQKVFLMKITLVLWGHVPSLNHGPICFPVWNTKGGTMGHWKLSTTFLTLSKRIKAHLLWRLCINNCSIGGAYVSLLNLFSIFDHITTGPFSEPLSGHCPDVKKLAGVFSYGSFEFWAKNLQRGVKIWTDFWYNNTSIICAL